MIELLCAWCICTVSNQTLLECSACSTGTQSEALKTIAKYATQSGQMAEMECKKPGEKFALSWNKGARGK